MLDTELKPWILEVNLSPSLVCDSPLDYHIKSNVLIDSLNVVGIRKVTRKHEVLGKILKLKTPVSGGSSASGGKLPKRFPMSQLNVKSCDTKAQQSVSFQSHSSADDLTAGFIYDEKGFEKLSKLSAKHRDIVREALEEFGRCKNFTRIFPVSGTHYYDKFFEQPKQSNRILYRYLYSKTELSTLIGVQP